MCFLASWKNLIVNQKVDGIFNKINKKLYAFLFLKQKYLRWWWWIGDQKNKVKRLAFKSSPYACPSFSFIGRMILKKKKKRSGQTEGQKTKVEHLACKSSPYAWPFFFIGRMIVHLIKIKKQSRQNVACYGKWSIVCLNRFRPPQS